MPRSLLLAALLILLPSAAEAQPRLMFGGGFTAPQGDISDIADPGWHLAAGLDLGIPSLPVGIRGDARLHRMSATDALLRDNEYLTGSLSLVFRLPGVGLEPYVLAGLGSYRYSGGLRSDPETMRVTDTGYHGGFGVVIGGLGPGAYAEIRYVQINADTSARLIPLTIGFRL